MAWELRPAIAGIAVAGLFLGVILATSTARALARPVKGSIWEGLRVGLPIEADWILWLSSRDNEFAASLLRDADRTYAIRE